MEEEIGWMRRAKWGVFAHYLGDTTSEEWNKQIDAFDVKGLVGQLKEINPGYFFLTLGQNSGLYCSPNSVYERYAGYGENERCSRRDIPMELGKELRASGIRLLLYVSASAPQADENAANGLGCLERAYFDPTNEGWWDWGITPLFTRRWSEVLQAWAVRYGELVSGWWIDGCYAHVGFRNEHANAYKDAFRKGNPAAICAFNPGVKTPIIRAFDADDYTAGETNSYLPVDLSEYAGGTCSDKLRDAAGAQFHVLTFLGERWASHRPRLSDAFVYEYTKQLTDCGGVITWDAGISPNGHLSVDCLQQLRVLKGIRPKCV